MLLNFVRHNMLVDELLCLSFKHGDIMGGCVSKGIVEHEGSVVVHSGHVSVRNGVH